MLTLAADDIQSIKRRRCELSFEAQGEGSPRGQLLRQIFSRCSTSQCKLISVRSAGSRLTALEARLLDGKQLPRLAEQLYVYAFTGGRIARVYYFPSERDSPPNERARRRCLDPDLLDLEHVWLFIKLGVRDVPPVTFAAMRLVIAILVMVPVTRRNEARRRRGTGASGATSPAPA